MGNKVDAIFPTVRHHSEAKGSLIKSQDPFAIAFADAQSELSGVSLSTSPPVAALVANQQSLLDQFLFNPKFECLF
ncbi:hypothetical protein BDN67DRAFT_1017569 [Paxillus ammoniavirescens]|nr:hypothetical protein BDN67DRAFT_1017569 [Paxillus ammoniavirescens]